MDGRGFSENKERSFMSRRGGCVPRRRLVASAHRLLEASSRADSRRQDTTLVHIGAMDAGGKNVAGLAAFRL